MTGKKILYTPHLKLRLKIRNIPFELPERIYKGASGFYYDKETAHYIAIKEVKFKGKQRELAVIYDEFPNRIEIITIHPLRPYQKSYRIKTGRWEKL